MCVQLEFVVGVLFDCYVLIGLICRQKDNIIMQINNILCIIRNTQQ